MMSRRILSLFVIVILTASMLLSCSYENPEVLGSDADNSAIIIIDIPLTEEAYGIGVDKDNPELLSKINEFIEAGLKDGTYEEITGHFFDADKKPVPIYSAKLDANKDQLVVATTGDFEPFDYDEDDAHYGIDKELINAIADHLGKELVLVNVNFDMIFMTVYQKKCDVCIAGITIREDREKYVDFSVPYFHDGQIIAVREDNTEFENAKTKEDIEKILLELDETKIIAVEGETSGDDYLKGGDSGGFPGVKCKVESCLTLEDALTELSHGDVDYVLGDSASLKYIIANEFNN